MSVPERRLVITAGARRDLRGILRFTERRWGSGQKATYKARLDEAMHGLLVHPFRGQPRDDLSSGLHGLTVSAHIVFYRVSERDVTIVRILHGAMDAAAVFE
jgi:toxin ParE1/3/4